MEPPMQNTIDADLMYDLINWTATYRRDSTVPFPYYIVRPRTETDAHEPSDPRTNYAEGRRNWSLGPSAVLVSTTAAKDTFVN
jgi:hypothetical protein